MREAEGVAEEVERGWSCTEYCFLQWFRTGFGVGVVTSGAVGWHGKKVRLQDVLLFAMVLQRFLMSGFGGGWRRASGSGRDAKCL